MEVREAVNEIKYGNAPRLDGFPVECLRVPFRVNHFYLVYILEKNDINKTCRSCFENMFLFVKIFCQP